MRLKCTCGSLGETVMQSVHPLRSSGVINGRTLTATLTHSAPSIPRKAPCYGSNPENSNRGTESCGDFQGEGFREVRRRENSNLRERERERVGEDINIIIAVSAQVSNSKFLCARDYHTCGQETKGPLFCICSS